MGAGHPTPGTTLHRRNHGGAYLGGVASLEDRAQMPSYQAMFRSLIDVLGPRPGETILEIGCGAGSLVRLLAKPLGSGNPITAADINPFLLREAAQLADADGVAGLIQFPASKCRGAAVRG
jgi:ubiquinone/menaquinone biosynthesis C-methylase UbiE